MLLAMAGIAVHMLLVGVGTSVVRPAIMGNLALIVGHHRRRVQGPSRLAATTIRMSWINPLMVRDAGRQFSAASTREMVLHGRRFEALLDRIPGRFTTAARARQAAMVGAEPRPAQPALIISGGVALMLGTVWLPLGCAAAWLP